MAKLRLLGNRLLVKPILPEIKSESGIYYDMSRQDDRKRWYVIDAGPKAPPEIKAGVRILTTGDQNLFEFTDKVQIIDAREVVAVW